MKLNFSEHCVLSKLQIKPDKLKKMNKKQLRMVKKTAMNKNGQIELVNPY